MTATPPAAQRIFTPRMMVQTLLSLTIPLAIVAAAVGPRSLTGLARLPTMHWHGPQLDLLAQAPPVIQLHLAAVLTAFAIGVVLLIGAKGRQMHRILGWTWVVAMMTGAVSSLFIRIINHGALSYIHLLAGWTIVALPMAVVFARRHKVRLHARMMTGLFTGGLVLAGLLAFMPGRLLWQVWFG